MPGEGFGRLHQLDAELVGGGSPLTLDAQPGPVGCSAEVTTKGGVMTKIKMLIGTCVAAGALVGLGAPTAAAAPPSAFTITENFNFTTGEATFTATGALCPSGTIEDQVKTDAGHPDTSGAVNLLIRTVYTCADGSGTFYAQKHVLLTLNEDDSFTNTGPITFHGGTGDYIRLSGHGIDVGAGTAGVFGVGEISGVLKLG